MTDHQPLLALERSEEGKMLRWGTYLQQYDLVIQHVPGRKNWVADWLSRSMLDDEEKREAESDWLEVQVPETKGKEDEEDEKQEREESALPVFEPEISVDAAPIYPAALLRFSGLEKASGITIELESFLCPRL
eukprot:GHVQ01030895.1.p2 GENE.GHVQ01030895.1~~GHVQ01030895.1.p2  ORF type:complete len:133 (+),score=25.04 GHVQ01030895.1:691-1089(+)